MTPRERPAVVLLSGGLDSSTLLALVRTGPYATNALTFRYGQRHLAEIEASQRIAGALGVRRHVILDIDLRVFGGSALTDDISVPRGRRIEEISGNIPVTYVPARNTIFLS
ncbi:MAG: 7-cyano-7-deazaguanine synthase, partial [Syntrophorhabdales bacterium]